jgi:DNA repair protein RadD
MTIAPSKVRDILFALRTNGPLSRDQIIRAWRLTQIEYQDLERSLSAQEDVVIGPQHRGFSVISPRALSKAHADGSAAADDETRVMVPVAARASATTAVGPDSESRLRSRAPLWQQAAASRLAELLSASTLTKLLGDLEKVVRQVRRLTIDQDRPSTKLELSYALLVVHAEDLFAVPELRAAVAKVLKLHSPARWHPGKSAALNFVRESGFPTELAGTPGEAKPDSFEYLEPPAELRALEDYQLEVRDKLLEIMGRLGGRAVVALPTGAGKTRVAVETVLEFLTRHYRERDQLFSVVWLAHTEELCEQACQSFIDVWRSSPRALPLHLVRYWGDHGKGTDAQKALLERMTNGHSLLVSSPRRLLTTLTDRRNAAVSGAILSSVKTLIIDEAHRAAAPTYRSILNQVQGADEPVRLIGLTATPFRMEYRPSDPAAGTKELLQLFGQLVEPTRTLGRDPKRRLQELEVLAQPRSHTLRSARSVTLDGLQWSDPPTEEETKILDERLARATDNANRRRLVILSLRQLVETHKAASVLYFGPSVDDAHAVAYSLREAGFAAAAISGKTRDTTRRRLVADFRDGRIQVLANCEVLTTGFDAPCVSHVFIARPTVSEVLYEQMVGRGLRGPRFGGTRVCTIIDVEDAFTDSRPRLGFEYFRELWQSRP